MTQISYIHGLDNNDGIDIALNPAEIHMKLLRNRVAMLQNSYGNNVQYKNALNLIDNSFNQGIIVPSKTGATFVDQIIDNIAYASAIKKNVNGTNQFDKELKMAMFQGLAPELPSINERIWINSYLIRTGYASRDWFTQPTKDTKTDNSALTGKHNEVFKGFPPKSAQRRVAAMYEFALKRFQDFEVWRKAMYNKWEPLSHHVMYEFIDNPSLQPSIVQTKSLLHKQALDITSQIAYVDRATLTLWTDNGIMKGNTNQGLPAFTGIESIELLSGKNPKIGALDPVTQDFILKLIGAIGGALFNAAAFVIAIKGTPEGDFISNAQGFSTESFSPNKDDFNNGSGGGSGSGLGSGLGNNIPLILGGIALAYYLSTNKK